MATVRKHKDTHQVSNERIREVARMILNFDSKRVITDHLCTKYGLKPRSCDSIITHAYEYIKDNFRKDRESIIITHIQFYYGVAKQWETVDPRAALKALEQVEKLLKLHLDNPIIMNSTLNMNLESVTDQQLKDALESLKTTVNNGV